MTLSLNKVVDYEKLPFVAPVLLYIMGRTSPPTKRGLVGCISMHNGHVV